MTRPHPKDIFSLQDRVAVVTGACGQLGLEFVKTLAQAGARVVLADVTGQKPLLLAQRCQKQFGGHMLGVEMDVTRPQNVEAGLRRILQWGKRVDILVNNAGIGIFTPWESRTEAEAENIININLKGVLWCTKIFSRAMREKRKGTIINLGSVYGIVSADPRIYGRSGRNSAELYAATKGGVIQMTRYMAVHLAPDNIRVNCISPGGIFNRQLPAFVKRYAEKTPLARMGRPSDLAGALIYLASDASSYVTGQNLAIDGGFTAW